MGLGTNSVLNRIVHPDLHADLPRVYPAVVTIQAPTESQGDDYAVVQAWANVTGLTAVRGMLAAAKAEETRRAELTGVKLTHVCDLPGYYPQITVSHRAVIARASGETAVTYNITGVKHDSQAASTRLELEIVSH